MSYKTSRSFVYQSRFNKEDGYRFIVFLFWPFLGAVLSLLKLNRKASWFIICGFCLIFGLTFNPVNDQLDSFRYALEFNSFMSNAEVNLHSTWSDYMHGDLKDVYTPLCYYLTYLLGGNIHILFLIFAAVFAFFSLQSVNVLVKNSTYKNTAICVILMTLVFYSNSIFNINGVRFWTAAWIGVYATLKIIIEDRKKYFILLSITPFVHGTFWLFIVFVTISYFIKSGVKPLLIAYIISFFFTEFVLKRLSDALVDQLPAYMQQFVWSYIESEGALRKISGESIKYQPLYWKILTSLTHYYELFLVALLAVESKHFSRKCQNLIKFLLSYLIAVNLFSAIPSMGRYYFLMVPIIAFIWISEKEQLYSKKGFVYAIPFVILYGAFQLYRYIISTNGIGIFMPLPILGI